MPTVLHDKSVFSLLGQCAPNLSTDGVSLSNGIDEFNGEKTSNCHYECGRNSEGTVVNGWGKSISQCQSLGGLSEQCRQVYGRISNWVSLVFDSDKKYENSDILWLPKLDHLCWNGRKVSNCDVHVCKS